MVPALCKKVRPQTAQGGHKHRALQEFCLEFRDRVLRQSPVRLHRGLMRFYKFTAL